MAMLMWRHLELGMPSVIPHICKVEQSHEPQHIRSTRPVQQLMDHGFEPLDGSPFNQVLLLVVWFRKLILDQQQPLEIFHIKALFLFGIVPAQGTGCTLSATEIPVDVHKLRLGFEAKCINVIGLEAIENLSSNEPITQTLAVGKDGIC